MLARTGRVLSRSGFVLWPVVLFSLLTIFMTWPLALHLGDSVVGPVGDNFYFTWLVWWFKRALLDLHTLPLTVPFFNYPEGWNLAYNEITPAMAVMAMPFAVVGGPVFGYNMAMLLSFVLSGLGTFLWVRRLTQNSLAAVVAGTIFAFTPYRLAHLWAGHLNLMGTQWFPFYFMFFHQLLESRRWRWKPALLAALFLGLIGLTSQYYLYMAIVLSVVWAAAYLLLVRPRAVLKPGLWENLGAFGLASLPLLALGMAPYLVLALQGTLSSRVFDQSVRFYSASPTNFVWPSTQQFLVGAWSQQMQQLGPYWHEPALYLGLIALGLAGLGLMTRRKALATNRIAVVLAATAFVAFVLALGTDFHWLGQTDVTGMPSFLQLTDPQGKPFLPLPGYFLFKYLPFYAMMRVWMRYGIFVSLFVSVLAGLGSAWLLSRVRLRLAVPLAGLLVVLILFEFYPGQQTLSAVQARPVDTWLAAQPAQGAVVQLPIAESTRPEFTYYASVVEGKPFAGGFFLAFYPQQFTSLWYGCNSFPDEKSVQSLQQFDIQYVVVDTEAYGGQLAATRQQAQSLGLQLLATVGGQDVYAVPLPATGLQPSNMLNPR
jgi:hypothetical protein